MLFWAAVLRPIWASIFIETASPALSSAGETTFEPDDKRARDLLSCVEDCMSRFALLWADRLVLMTIITLSVSRLLFKEALILRSVLAAGAHLRAVHHLIPPTVSGCRLPIPLSRDAM